MRSADKAKPATSADSVPASVVQRAVKQGTGPLSPRRNGGWREIEARREKAALKASLADVWDEDFDLDEEILADLDHTAEFFTTEQEEEEEDGEEADSSTVRIEHERLPEAVVGQVRTEDKVPLAHVAGGYSYPEEKAGRTLSHTGLFVVKRNANAGSEKGLKD